MREMCSRIIVDLQLQGGSNPGYPLPTTQGYTVFKVMDIVCCTHCGPPIFCNLSRHGSIIIHKDHQEQACSLNIPDHPCFSRVIYSLNLSSNLPGFRKEARFVQSIDAHQTFLCLSILILSLRGLRNVVRVSPLMWLLAVLYCNKKEVF